MSAGEQILFIARAAAVGNTTNDSHTVLIGVCYSLRRSRSPHKNSRPTPPETFGSSTAKVDGFVKAFLQHTGHVWFSHFCR